MDAIWQEPPEDLALTGQEVHVWRVELTQPPAVLERLRCFLNADEIARAQRFRFERDRQHFIVARGLLREFLGRYLRHDPATLQFCYNAYGKPALEPGQELTFNLSHSHDLALYAFALRRDLGIDVEYMRDLTDAEQIARHYFSELEQQTLLSLPQEARAEAFFQCWTRKEAYIKARGRGLSLALDLFDVSLGPDEPAALLASREDPQELERWQLQALIPGPGYAAALVGASTGWQMRCWDYRPR